MFNCMLAGTVLAYWIDRMCLIAWKLFGFTVYGSTRRNVDETLYSKFLRVFEQIDRTKNVNTCVNQRLSNRTAHIHLGCMVTDIVRFFGFEYITDLRATNIDLVEPGCRI